MSEIIDNRFSRVLVDPMIVARLFGLHPRSSAHFALFTITSHVVHRS